MQQQDKPPSNQIVLDEEFVECYAREEESDTDCIGLPQAEWELHLITWISEQKFEQLNGI